MRRQIWLETAYRTFARHGESALKIDTLANLTGKSRSSFYHLFGDMEEFFDALLKYNLKIAKQFADETRDIDRFFPDYVEIVVKYRDMFFFIRHILFGKTTNKKYEEAWNKISKITGDKTSELWLKMVKLDRQPANKRGKFYEMIRTSAFLRMQYDNFTYENIHKIVQDVNRSFGFMIDE